MSYWTDRQRQLNSQMEKDEAALKKRLSSFYDVESKKLEREIAAYYQKYGEKDVIEYRKLKESLSSADRKMLMEQMDDFAKKYPEYKHLLPVRESIYKLDRLEGLQHSVKMQMLEIGAINNKEIEKHLEKQAFRGINATAELLGFGKNFYFNNPEIARLFVNTAWADGKNFSQRIWGNTEKLANYLNTDIAQGFARGDSYEKMVRNLRNRFGRVSRNDAYRLIYTEGTYVMAESTIQPFIEDFEEYRLSTVGDGRVCPICRGLESETFRIKDRQPGVNFPPLHTWCRCTFTIEVKDWNTWMTDYERRHGNGQAEKVADSLRDRSVEEAKDKDGVYTELWNLSKDIIERSLQINNFLNLLDLPKSEWSGKTIIDDAYLIEKRASGACRRNGDIILKSNSETKTIIHEHLHTRSFLNEPKNLREYFKLEEGTVEYLAEEICENQGIAYNPMYKSYVGKLREICEITGQKDEYDFAKKIFEIPLSERYNYLDELRNNYLREHSKLSKEKRRKLNAAVDGLSGKK